MEITPDQLRWSPFEENNEQSRDFQQGLVTLGGVGEPEMKSGLRIHIYFANADMAKKAMQNSDGDFLIVPQQGTMRVTTELGVFEVEPQEIIVIPRGFRFSVSLCGGSSQPLRGYILEVFNGHFELPNLGPIGANGLANPREFLVPTASFSREDSEWVVVNKYMGRLFQATQSCTPFNVVAWHGNYVPFKYDLRKFCTMNSVSFDHPVRAAPLPYFFLCPSHSSDGSTLTRLAHLNMTLFRIHRFIQCSLVHRTPRAQLSPTSSSSRHAGWLWKILFVRLTS